MARAPEPPPVKYCPEKKCGKKMSAFKRGRGWKHVCPDAAKHAEDRLKILQARRTSRGGVKKGTRSPMLGRQRDKKYVTRYPWSPKTKPEDKGKKP